MKSRPELKGNDLFDEDPLDRTLELIARVKEDMKHIEAGINAQRAVLTDARTMLHEAQDIFFQIKQADLFQENDIDSDNDIFSELVDIAGKEAANRLVDFYSGSSIYIPKNIIIEQKHREIREEFKNGSVYRELAVRYGYSERYVRTIIHKKERKNEQC
jgi:Mor family transcriptional regulator